MELENHKHNLPFSPHKNLYLLNGFLEGSVLAGDALVKNPVLFCSLPQCARKTIEV